jgi:hypothetical protein
VQPPAYRVPKPIGTTNGNIAILLGDWRPVNQSFGR